MTLLAHLTMAQTAPGEPTASWSVNENRTLVWQDKPYIPVGVRWDGQPESLAAIKAAGIQDVIWEAAADGSGWETQVEALRSSGLNYFLDITSGAPEAPIYSVEPEGYRVGNLVGAFHFELKIPGATTALVILAANRDRSIRWQKRLAVVNDRLPVDDPRGPGSPHSLLIYPALRDKRTADFWEGFDLYRDKLLTAVKRQNFGPGFRGILNPLGNMTKFLASEPQFVPMSGVFQVEFETFLQQKYGAVATAQRAWSLSANDLQSFRDMSRLVPLWSGQRGVSYLWNPRDDQTIRADMNQSLVWADIREVIRTGAQRRFNRLVQSLKQIVSVPVLQEWHGWQGPYEAPDTELDGVTFTGEADSIVRLIDTASGPASTVARRSKRMVGVAADIALSETGQGPAVEAIQRELEGIGIRAFFFRTAQPAQYADIAAVAAKVAADGTAAEWRPQALFFPEGARDPAVPARLLGGLWWMPGPGNGDRIEFGAGISGYRYFDQATSVLVFWSETQPQKVRLRAVTPKELTFEALDGSDLQIKVKKNEIEMTLPTSPVIVRSPSEIPVPLTSYQETVAMLEGLLNKFGNRADASGNEIFFFRDSLKGYDRNPGGSFLTMRQQLERLIPKAAPYAWIEAESTTDTTFGSAPAVPGSSNGKCLSIRTRLAPTATGYYARYPILSGTAGQHEVWVAGRIPSPMRESTQLIVNGQTLTAKSGPVSLYGQGLGWYSFGTATLPANGATVQVVCGTELGAELELDVIMLSPTPFVPQGPRMPVAWLKQALAATPAKGKGSGAGGTVPPTPAPAVRRS